MHCSAGIGRSGTFCLVDSCLVIVSFSLYVILNFLKCLIGKGVKRGSRKCQH